MGVVQKCRDVGIIAIGHGVDHSVDLSRSLAKRPKRSSNKVVFNLVVGVVLFLEHIIVSCHSEPQFLSEGSIINSFGDPKEFVHHLIVVENARVLKSITAAYLSTMVLCHFQSAEILHQSSDCSVVAFFILWSMLAVN